MAAKIHSQREIYQVIEQHLREASKPLTVSELLDLPDMRAAAIAEYGNEVRVYTDRLSNALGLMWRREIVNRYPAPEQANSQARFAYEWPKDKPEKPVLPSIFPKAKTGVVVTEQDGGVLIEFEKFTILVRSK